MDHSKTGVSPLPHMEWPVGSGKICVASDLPKPGKRTVVTPNRRLLFTAAILNGLISREKFIADYRVPAKKVDNWLRWAAQDRNLELKRPRVPEEMLPKKRASDAPTDPSLLLPYHTLTLPPGPFAYTAPELAVGNGRGHLYLMDATGRKIGTFWGTAGEKLALAELIVAARNKAAE